MSTPRRPTRLMDVAEINSGYPNELFVDPVTGNLTLLKADGTQLRIFKTTQIKDSSGVIIGTIAVTEEGSITIPAATNTASGLVKLSNVAPNASGVAASGTATDVSRSDHAHPLQESANKLTNARSINLAGVTATGASFDGSQNVSINVTAVPASLLTGLISIQNIPPASIERLIPVPNEAARLALTIDKAQNGDTIKQIDTSMLYYVIDDTKLNTNAGYEPYTAGTATAVAWGGITGIPDYVTNPAQLSKAATTGAGNAVTDVSVSDHTITLTKGLTFLTEHPSIAAGTDTTSTAAPVHGGTFTSIDGVTKDANGHVTKVNTKTVTLPNTEATTLASGLMSSADKSKLNNIADNANNYILPVAGTSLGGIVSGTDISIDVDGNASVVDNSHNHTIGNVTGLQAALDGKETSFSKNTAFNKDFETSVANIKENGTQSIGTLTTIARADHVHPLQTTVSGNAGSSTKLASARTISATGDASVSVSFDGSKDVSGVLTLSDSGVTGGSYGQATDATVAHGGTLTVPYVTLDSKGRTTKALNKVVTLPTETALSVESTGTGNAITAVAATDHKITLTKGLTFLTEHPTVAVSANTISTAAPAHGETFTSVDTVLKDANGHVTKINTKTVTLPIESVLSKGTNTGNGNAVTDVSVAGHVVTLTKGLTFLTEHPDISTVVDTTSAVAPAYNGAFTTVNEVTRDANGHVTKINTKTVTLPVTTFSNLSGVPTTIAGYGLTTDFTTQSNGIINNMKGIANGLVPLGSDSLISAVYLPSYVDDVLEFTALAKFPAVGEAGKVYVDTTTNKTYRWSGTTYTPIGNDLAIGTVAGTAYDGALGAALRSEFNAHKATVLSDTTSTASSAFGGTITTIDGVTRNADGHVTKINTKTVTLPSESALSRTVTGSGNAVTDVAVSGHAVTITKGINFLTEHPTIVAGTDTTSTASPIFGGTFTAIDGVTKDANGHVTKLNTKTISIPSNTMTGATATNAGTVGLVPAPEAAKQGAFLRGDGQWVIPADTTYGVMQGATATTAGAIGLVPAPAIGDNTKVLRGDATWAAEAALSKGATTGAGNAVTDVSVDGHTVTLTKGLTFLTEHPAVSIVADDTSSASATHGGTFTAVGAITKDANGHVTKVTTKTVTMPNESSLSIGTATGSGNAVTSIGVSGHTITLAKDSTFLTAHPGIMLATDSISAESPAFGGSVITVDGVTRDGNGHVIKINTKTVALPAQTALSKAATNGGGNAVTEVDVSGHTVTLTKGATFLTAHPAISIAADSSTSQSIPSASGFSVIDSVTRDSNGHVSKVNTKTVNLQCSLTYSATVGTTWSGSGPYTQAITVNGILGNDNPIVDIDTANIAYANVQAVLEAYATMYRMVTANNSITVYSTAATTTAVPIQIKVIR